MARKIAGGFGQQAAFALALACLLMVVMPVMPAPHAEDLGAPVAPPMSPPCDVLVGVQCTVRLAGDANYVA
jgi:hypothetical protein